MQRTWLVPFERVWAEEEWRSGGGTDDVGRRMGEKWETRLRVGGVKAEACEWIGAILVDEDEGKEKREEMARDTEGGRGCEGGDEQ